LKSTARNLMDTRFIRYPLPVKNYEDLRHENYQVPRILVVVVMPALEEASVVSHI
jgi:hypothetical protein